MPKCHYTKGMEDFPDDFMSSLDDYTQDPQPVDLEKTVRSEERWQRTQDAKRCATFPTHNPCQGKTDMLKLVKIDLMGEKALEGPNGIPVVVHTLRGGIYFGYTDRDCITNESGPFVLRSMQHLNGVFGRPSASTQKCSSTVVFPGDILSVSFCTKVSADGGYVEACVWKPSIWVRLFLTPVSRILSRVKTWIVAVGNITKAVKEVIR